MSSPNTQPIFVKTPNLGIATVNNNVVGRGGTASPVEASTLLATAGSWGGFVHSIYALPVANDEQTIPACLLRIFRKASGDTNLIMCLPEILLPAINTINNTTPLLQIEVPLPDVVVGDVGTRGLLLGSGDSLYAALSLPLSTASYNVIAQLGFY